MTFLKNFESTLRVVFFTQLSHYLVTKKWYLGIQKIILPNIEEKPMSLLKFTENLFYLQSVPRTKSWSLKIKPKLQKNYQIKTQISTN